MDFVLTFRHVRANDGDMAHLPSWSAIALTIQMYLGTRDGKSLFGYEEV